MSEALREAAEAWPEVIGAPKDTGPLSATGVPLRSKSKFKAPKAHKVVGAKWTMKSILVLAVFIFGCLEAHVWKQRVRRVLRANQDSSLFVSIHPYDATDKEYTFGVRTYSESSTLEATFNLSGKQATGDTGKVSAVLFGKSSSLKTKECNHIVQPLSPGTAQLGIYICNTYLKVEPDSFEACDDLLVGEVTSFEDIEVNLEEIFRLAIGSLCVWIVLVYSGFHREVTRIGYDNAYAPLQVSRNGWKLLGGRRILWRNMFHIALRPFLLFGVLPAQVLRSWLSIQLHPECPQLIMQNFNVEFAVTWLILAVATCTFYIVSEFVDIWECPHNVWEWPMVCVAFAILPCVLMRFKTDDDVGDLTPKSLGREHYKPIQDILECCFAAVVLAIVLLSWLLGWPYTFIIEWRFLFDFAFFGFSISRWAHLLRISATLMFLTDLMSFLFKSIARPSVVGFSLEYAPAERKRDRDYVLEVVQGNGRYLQFAAEELKGDREIVLAAVSNYGWALRYAAQELQSDREIVLAAETSVMMATLQSRFTF